MISNRASVCFPSGNSIRMQKTIDQERLKFWKCRTNSWNWKEDWGWDEWWFLLFGCGSTSSWVLIMTGLQMLLICFKKNIANASKMPFAVVDTGTWPRTLHLTKDLLHLLECLHTPAHNVSKPIMCKSICKQTSQIYVFLFLSSKAHTNWDYACMWVYACRTNITNCLGCMAVFTRANPHVYMNEPNVGICVHHDWLQPFHLPLSDTKDTVDGKGNSVIQATVL